jgi:hypothetical protein
MTKNHNADIGPSSVNDEEAALESELARLLEQTEGRAPRLDALFEQISARMADERGLRAFLRSRSTLTRISIAAGTISGVVLLVLSAFLRPDIAVYPQTRMAIVLLLIGALLALSLGLSLRPMQLPALPSWATPSFALASMLSLLGLHSLPAAHLSHPASLVYGAGLGAQLLRATPCVMIGLWVGVPTYALLAALDRGGNSRSLAHAVTAALVASFLLQLCCPVTAPAHMLIGHFGVALLLLAGCGLLFRTAP